LASGGIISPFSNRFRNGYKQHIRGSYRIFYFADFVVAIKEKGNGRKYKDYCSFVVYYKVEKTLANTLQLL